MTFSNDSGYTVSDYKMDGDSLLIGEEKTYEADGTFLFRATYRNRLLSADVNEPTTEGEAKQPHPELEREE